MPRALFISNSSRGLQPFSTEYYRVQYQFRLFRFKTTHQGLISSLCPAFPSVIEAPVTASCRVGTETRCKVHLTPGARGAECVKPVTTSTAARPGQYLALGKVLLTIRKPR